ncbi:hypothetical protein ES044_08650 [Polaribacter sp. IC066]|uniref:hypothetical protein n=1 Tax=Polaribacter sp. IC066 TaxID=57032 RepID=UPI0011BD8489|nr:hypothetical protein [Polaribacter sp. IC066]TXD59975.1 hypothetical protein ES044_08650 [Polaribacter sp. IC066]
MTKNIYNKIFLLIAIFASVVNSYANSSFHVHEFSNGLHSQKTIKIDCQLKEFNDSTSFFKSLLPSNKDLFFAEEINIEDFEKHEKKVSLRLKKSLFGGNSNAIFFKTVFENSYLKVKEKSIFQKTLTDSTPLNLYKKFEVYII